MPETPTYSVSVALHMIREALANSTAFRTWAGVATAALARLRVVWGVEATDYPDRPFVILKLGEDAGTLSKVASGTFVGSGSALLALFDEVSEANRDDASEAAIEARNSVGELLAAVRGIDGYEVSGVRLELRDIEVLDVLEFESPETANDAAVRQMYRGAILLRWGPEA